MSTYLEGLAARQEAERTEAHRRAGLVARCPVCPRHCTLDLDALGACHARRNVGGEVVCDSYSRVTSLAIDPIEKKPLATFMPGTRVLSLGSYGCNLRCPFCQNHEISQVGADEVPWRQMTPGQVADVASAQAQIDPGMVGVAYTYNEPLVGWEWVRDCARLVHDAGLVNVLVSNGCAESGIIRELMPLIDAANIDLKSFSADFYQGCGGDLDCVKGTIRLLAGYPGCHLEVTTLVIPGANDSDAEMDALAAWIASLDPVITLHVTRFFPRWKMHDAEPTPEATLYHLAEVARRHLENVFVGNV
ncbi:MAG: AmmeMemoRadiSam system radical SAM enzyme [Atopobiaceae bacterium]|jgi:pyruvate formate lyase activating enzyme|nr:AmmeMemoRadiSam system radical SAM enzyme [Atopobiaceae bacterium]MCH4181475.1 AmmeMemoRadiSam system radical SAM enzyme [Atopobiaceae bacterium]MCH4214843.1 AmmeMemoRadiSam system radical SAM enzyme [Atopobiaceae bacterium]MCH4230089.1 AmmeMemoRadiSam system radical SAM enzyme [Atopobiaceae bacterium]MCH4276965.1 AmmeMemoRadiSam system radical SAM enzyme [Atopobiaceae bacterium]